MNGITQSTALWYASRATGVVSLVLLTAVVVLGILVNRQGRLPGLPRFAVTGLHRNLSLLALAFLAVHVVTAVTDSYVAIRLSAAIIPFTSQYLPLQIGLGAVALDLIAALIITSLLRVWIGRRLWRGVHWLAYAAYPVTVVHSVTSADDLRSGALLGLTAACMLSVAAAVWYRLTAGAGRKGGAGHAAGPGKLAGGMITAAADRDHAVAQGSTVPGRTAVHAGTAVRHGTAHRGTVDTNHGGALAGHGTAHGGAAARTGTGTGTREGAIR